MINKRRQLVTINNVALIEEKNMERGFFFYRTPNGTADGVYNISSSVDNASSNTLLAVIWKPQNNWNDGSTDYTNVSNV